jgi:signal peptidase II
MKLSPTKKAILLVIIVLFIDQAIKIWIKTHMALGESFQVFGSKFLIHFTENPGMAFGMQFGGENGKLILSIFRIVAVIGITWYLYHLIKTKVKTGLILCFALILAGAVGNILDSAFYGLIFDRGMIYNPAINDWERYYGVAQFSHNGYAGFLKGCVVDMLYFPLIEGHYPGWIPFWGGKEFMFFRPVFNIADSSITIGVFLILIFQKRFFHSDKSTSDNKAEKEVGADEVSVQ